MSDYSIYDQTSTNCQLQFFTSNQQMFPQDPSISSLDFILAPKQKITRYVQSLAPFQELIVCQSNATSIASFIISKFLQVISSNQPSNTQYKDRNVFNQRLKTLNNELKESMKPNEQMQMKVEGVQTFPFSDILKAASQIKIQSDLPICIKQFINLYSSFFKKILKKMNIYDEYFKKLEVQGFFKLFQQLSKQDVLSDGKIFIKIKSKESQQKQKDPKSFRNYFNLCIDYMIESLKNHDSRIQNIQNSILGINQSILGINQSISYQGYLLESLLINAGFIQPNQINQRQKDSERNKSMEKKQKWSKNQRQQEIICSEQLYYKNQRDRTLNAERQFAQRKIKNQIQENQGQESLKNQRRRGLDQQSSQKQIKNQIEENQGEESLENQRRRGLEQQSSQQPKNQMRMGYLQKQPGSEQKLERSRQKNSGIKVKAPKKVNTCHPFRKHHAHNLCLPCYNKIYRPNN